MSSNQMTDEEVSRFHIFLIFSGHILMTVSSPVLTGSTLIMIKQLGALSYFGCVLCAFKKQPLFFPKIQVASIFNSSD